MSTYEEETYKKIGKNLRKHRSLQGISQEKLSEMLGVNGKFIGHVERFERYVSLKRLIQISEILKVKLEDLIKS
jgi:transcriptional regulator with XRE-family HTH domain